MNKKYLMMITHSIDDQDRANAAIAMAVSLLSEEADLVMFFLLEGGLFCKQGVAETIAGKNFAPVKDLFPTLLEEKVKMFLCGACAKTHSINEDNIVEGIDIVNMPSITPLMMERETIIF